MMMAVFLSGEANELEHTSALKDPRGLQGEFVPARKQFN